jgi:hypothetical protein
MGIIGARGRVGDGHFARRFFLLFLFALLLPCLLSAQAIAVKEYGYTLDLPVGWEPFDASDPAKLSFSDPVYGAMLQVTVFSHEKGLSAEKMEGDLRKEIKAKGEGVSFIFSGRDSFLSDVTFTSGGKDLRGYPRRTAFWSALPP